MPTLSTNADAFYLLEVSCLETQVHLFQELTYSAVTLESGLVRRASSAAGRIR